MTTERTGLDGGPDKRTGASTVTIQAVAAAAGVSKTTVSHVLSGNRPVSAETRRRVEKVMEDLGFTPNFFAQALNRNRSNSIALIAQDITNPFYPALARGLQAAVSSQDQVVMLFDAGADEGGLTHAFVTDAIQRRADGVVVAVSDVDDDIARLRDAGIPVVAVGSGASALPIDWVTADDERIAADAVMHLHLLGHRRIATITGPLTHTPGKPRHVGYLRAMQDLDLPVDPALIEHGEWTRESGFEAMRRLIALRDRPSAVFCANDLMAIGALDAAHQAGLSVPEDIAIIGVDDIDAAGLVRPALTTVRIPAEEIGRAAGELLLHRIAEGMTSTHRHVLVQHALIARESA
ncbi:LacI family DNA-binding transcriptional regulator [Leifsonia sp. TF02-11]|uniref:LacI family DNA-binding transcriptional regulator n=1 Tax=Leifsonia sp. TF02-11 TaxID=2815212 RepID=UPI001AA17260|nr:LacI family DNA-binding transcriptional regulator [Leifsonia sp. TF02-11]MBO1739417.1 LacI family DNA-binding transcriptional regulator [Leifsonia sp. TF02-11]